MVYKDCHLASARISPLGRVASVQARYYKPKLLHRHAALCNSEEDLTAMLHTAGVDSGMPHGDTGFYTHRGIVLEM